jgi:hypothetical protein
MYYVRTKIILIGIMGITICCSDVRLAGVTFPAIVVQELLLQKQSS